MSKEQKTLKSCYILDRLREWFELYGNQNHQRAEEELHLAIDELYEYQQKDRQLADLEAKLAESEKLAERLQQIVDKLRDKEFAGKTLVEAVNAVYEPLYKNKYDEAEELKQQLAEKEKRCEICGSKMILGELGYYCNNDELHPIYQAPNEAKSDYEKITLLKQDYDAMVEREELLRQQLTDKDKEIDNLYDRLNSKQKFYEMSLEKDYKEYLSRLDKLEKQCDKDKISFTIGELEKVKSAFGLINSKLDKVETIKEYIHYIDHQINELKEMK